MAKPIKKATTARRSPTKATTSKPAEAPVVDDVVDEEVDDETEGDGSPSPDNSLDSPDLTKDGDKSEEVTDGGDVDYSDTNPNPPRSETGTPLVEGSQDDGIEDEDDPEALNVSYAEEHVFEAPEVGDADHGDGVLGNQISHADSVENQSGANPPGITSKSAYGSGAAPLLVDNGESVEAPEQSKASVPLDSLILSSTEAPRFEADEYDDRFVKVKRNVYREVYFGRSKTPSYVKEFSKGTLVSKQGIAAQ